VRSRFGLSWVTALVVALPFAFAEARWARQLATQPTAELRALLVALGLLVPVALGAALLMSLLAPLFALRTRPGGAASSRALQPLLALILAVVLALVAELARRLLTLDVPPLVVAAALALGTWLLARPLLGAALTLLGPRRRSVPEPRWTVPTLRVLVAGVLLAAPIAWGIRTGTTNGDGGFWQVFGVLRRQELDLRPVLVLGGIFLGAALGIVIGRRCPPAVRTALVALATSAGVVALGMTGGRLLDDLGLRLAFERGAGLSRVSLRVLRAVTDRDGDGIGSWFGDVDCDDTRADIFPGALDVPGNGLDEDCVGGDALVPPPASVAPPLSAESQPALVGRVPPDLNLILITVDALRHDLGFAGYRRAISPHLDALASQSVVFERAYSLASYTGKSLGPLLIGRYSSETHRGWLHFNRFGPEDTFVQERLQSAAIVTLAVQGHWYFTPEYGLGRGFDVLDLSAAPSQRQLEGDKTVNSDKLSDAAIQQLSKPENTRGRFFLWMHYLDPHAEYMRHPGFDFGSRGRDLYDSEVAFTDREIGRLLDFVAKAEFGPRTAIVVTSDHGEAFGEHGMYRHGYELWEELVRVPLIVHVPGVAPQRQAVRRSAIDLVPTLLELLGVPLPSGEQRLSGVSLLADILASPGQTPAERAVFIDMSAGPYNEERQALVERDLKLVTSAGRPLGLYDLARDPEEKADRLKDAQLLEFTMQRMAAFRSQLRTVVVRP
jgi:choline-sulfatase